MALTEYQELACSSRGGGRLVSAAAGSGKTMVLVERLMRYVDEGSGIDDFLVVTYTRAAAGELRSRILSALNERISRRPHDRALRRQTELCVRAGIGTIDSLCGRFLRENAHLAGIAPDFKVVEPDRADAILSGVLDRMMDGIYETLDSHPGRKALIDSVGSGRDDAALADLLLRLHAAVQSHPHPEEWLRAQRAALSVPAGTDAGKTVWGEYVLSRTRAQAAYWADRLETALRQIGRPGSEKLLKAYGDSLARTAECLRAVETAAAAGWEPVRAALPVEYPRFGSYRGDDAASAESVKTARNACRKITDRWGHVFADDSASLLSEIDATAPALGALLELVELLDRAYAAEKRRQGVVDFSDQEHLMLRLLEDGSNGLAASLSKRYTELLVDEYQDVNACQDALFRLLSDGGKKLFMVGDVKQSIYRFRLADPTIFLQKFNTWPNAAPDTPPGEPGRILLRENFRSRPEVLEAANHVFANIMSPRLGELLYDEDSALRPGRAPDEDRTRVKLTVLTPPAAEEGAVGKKDKTQLEAEYVAAQIRALVESGLTIPQKDGRRPVNYGDFAILLRSYKSVAPRYRSALTRLGIPSVAQQGGGFFRSLEVTVLLSLLSVIDNPRQDVPLIAALRSPLFGFTADDLSAIRARDKDTDFYTALTLAAETDARCAAFLARLEVWRALAPDLRVEALLERIGEDTDLPALLSAMPDGEARRENLRVLAEYARQFEQDGYRGLFRFITWLKRLEERGEEPRTGALEQRQAVQLITIHHSKGLEYPIVFLSDTARQFNKSDTSPTVLIHPEMGVGGKVIDTALGIKYPSLAWRAISARLEEEGLSEQMRVLYVAMTRAKERLYVTGIWPDGAKLLNDLREGLTAPISDELLRGDNAPGKWLVRAALLPGSPMDLEMVTLTGEGPDAVAGAPAPAEREDAPAPAVPALGWSYPRPWAQTLPSKITASALEGSGERDEDAQALAPAEKRRASPRRPVLGEARPLTAAEKGTAAHRVLQFIDFARCGSAGEIRAEIARLREAGHLTPEQADAADPEMIGSFFRSETGRRVAAADQVWRELRFSLLVGAEEVFPVPPGEELLLQGVVDCCFREGEALTVVDYKTDYVTAETLSAKAAEYAPQLRAYALALGRMLGLPVKEGVLYFLRAGQAVKVPVK